MAVLKRVAKAEEDTGGTHSEAGRSDDAHAPLLDSTPSSGAPVTHVSDQRAFPPRLLTNAEVPSWYAHNDYIRSGYRPVTRSARLCLASLGYLHNESVNIYSHLLPAGATLLGNWWLHLYFASRFPGSSIVDQLVFHIYLTTSATCFGISSTYHTLLCHSAPYADFWGRLDYLAIVFQILGSFISGIYVGFYCEPHLQRAYWAMVRPHKPQTPI